jgi:hypothetical protein
MFTRELALDMISRAKTGFDMLTVADAIVAASPNQVQEDVAEDEVNPLEDFNYVGSPHHY